MQKKYNNMFLIITTMATNFSIFYFLERQIYWKLVQVKQFCEKTSGDIENHFKEHYCKNV